MSAKSDGSSGDVLGIRQRGKTDRVVVWRRIGTIGSV
jgi:hypothetical protein